MQDNNFNNNSNSDLKNTNLNRDWSHLVSVEQDISPAIYEEEVAHRKSILFKFFMGAFILMLIAGTYAGIKYYLGTNSISNEKINLNLSIDENVKGGQEGNMTLSILNTNKLPLSGAKVTVRTQKGFSKDGVIDQDTKIFNLGDIATNIYTATDTQYIFNGQEGDIRKIFVTLEYNVAGSNSSFKKELEKSVKIISPSIIVSIDGPKEIIEDYDYTFKFTVKNVSYSAGELLALKVGVPAGFTVEKNASTTDPTLFRLDNFKEGESRNFSVKGHFKASLSNSKTFTAGVSTFDGQNIKSLITEAVSDVDLISSPISFSSNVKVDGGDSKNFIIGRNNRIDLDIKNSSSNYVSDVVLMVSGDDVSTLPKFTFNKNSNTELEKINPGETRTIQINFADKVVSGENKINFEIYGKTRGVSNNILLKKFQQTVMAK